MRIRENIIRLREAKKWSRGKVGAHMTPPAPRQTIEKLENGTIPLTVDWIEKFAAALEVDMVALVVGAPGQFTLSEPVAMKVAEKFLAVAFPGEPIAPSKVPVVAEFLSEIVGMFSKHPATRTDLQALQPALDFLGKRP